MERCDVSLELKEDIDLVRIVALINFDGHLDKNLRSFYYSSKNIRDVLFFKDLVKRKLNLGGKLKLNSTGSNKQTHIFWVFNSKFARELEKIGIIKGDKVLQKYLIPSWILNNKEYCREFLKMAFFCEGSNKEEAGRKPRITFRMHKAESLLENGEAILNQMKDMLNLFDIKTTKIYPTNARPKKNGTLVKSLTFRISLEDNHKFINEIGWIKE